MSRDNSASKLRPLLSKKAANPAAQWIATLVTIDRAPVSLRALGPIEVRGKNPVSQDSPQWARHRAIIKKLYIDENKTLRDVMEIMRTHHGFDASPSMFKARLVRWGLFKNPRKVDRKVVSQRRQGKVVLGDREPRTLMQAPTTWTPPSPVSMQMQLPDEYNAPSHIFSCISTFMWGSYESGIWTTGELANAAFYEYAYHRPSAELLNSLQSLSGLLQAGEFQRAGPLMRLTAVQVEDVLRTQPVDLLSCLLEIKLQLQSTAPDLVASLMRYCADITREQFSSPGHPVRRLTSQLATLGSTEIAEEAYAVQLKVWQDIRDYGFRRTEDTVAVGAVWIVGLALTAGFQDMPSHLIPQLDDMMLMMSMAMEGSEWCKELLHSLAESGSIQLFTHDLSGKVLEIYLQLPGTPTKVAGTQPFARYKLANLNARCQHFAAERRSQRDAAEARWLLGTDMGSFFLRMADAIQGWLEKVHEHDRAAAVASYRERFLAAGSINVVEELETGSAVSSSGGSRGFSSHT